MFANSKKIVSNQEDVHEHLETIVSKHLQSPYQKPFQQHNLQAFDRLMEFIKSQSFEQLILDSCCGTAVSSRFLAQQNPNAVVVGVDQSLHRLNKNKEPLDNLILLQANCEDIWRLCCSKKICFDKHYILYPNPWPKKNQLKRRWHGHPVFSCLPKLAEQTILRSNWEIYLQEFSLAWSLINRKESELTLLNVENPMTAFEHKYACSGHPLYELTCLA